MKNDVRVTVSLKPEMYDQITEIAQASEVSISWVVRYAVERLISERKSGNLQQLSLPLERQFRTGRTG
jgi:metal-responsive CopG/Arc/MetJ family transcriptional regulator